MKRMSLLVTLTGALFLPAALHASPIVYSGTFLGDDQVKLFSFQVATAGVVTLRTFSYAGGVDGTGVTVPGGGFDPVLTLYDEGGLFLQTNDDAACGVVGKDVISQNCFDAAMSLSLGTGSYTLALTEADNLPVGDLPDSFSQVGNGNFSCPEFLGRPGAFCDASPSQRGARYEVEIDRPMANASPTPEPPSILLLSTGCSVMLALRRRFLK